MKPTNNDIPADIDDAIKRLHAGRDLTRTERAYLCGYLTAMQQARDMLQELEVEKLSGLRLSQ